MKKDKTKNIIIKNAMSNTAITEPKRIPSLSQEEREMVYKYILVNICADETKANILAEPFCKHADLGREFLYFLKNGSILENGIVVNGFSAKSLIENYKTIKNAYEAYSYLMFLREDEKYALELIKRGLPIKD